MKSKKKYETPKLFEYRVKYNAGSNHSALDNYHYYNAENASQALNFHNSMMKKHGFDNQIISIEKKNPYADKWENETSTTNQEV